MSASRWQVLLQLARADFLERVRRYSFLVTLLFAMYFGYLAATGKIMLRVGNMRGVYNSAWIGTLMSTSFIRSQDRASAWRRISATFQACAMQPSGR